MMDFDEVQRDMRNRQTKLERRITVMWALILAFWIIACGLLLSAGAMGVYWLWTKVP